MANPPNKACQVYERPGQLPDLADRRPGRGMQCSQQGQGHAGFRFLFQSNFPHSRVFPDGLN